MEQQYLDALKKIVQFTKQNEEFGEALRKELEIAPSANVNFLSENGLDQIYEYCVKEVLKKQAENFYANFPIKEIISQLKYDFVRMEDFKRHNEFGDYALAVYQQIENICNYIIQLPLFYAYFYYKVESEQFTGEISKSIFGIDKGEKEKYLTWGIDRLKENKLGAKDKYKAVVYFIGKSVKPNFYYIDLFTALDSIYLCRNTSHRGETNQQNKEKIKTAYDEYSIYFMKFNGAFVNFITLIQDGYSLLLNELGSCVVEVNNVMTGILFYTAKDGRTGSAEYNDNSIQKGDKIILLPKNRHKMEAVKYNFTV